MVTDSSFSTAEFAKAMQQLRNAKLDLLGQARLEVVSRLVRLHRLERKRLGINKSDFNECNVQIRYRSRRLVNGSRFADGYYWWQVRKPDDGGIITLRRDGRLDVPTLSLLMTWETTAKSESGSANDLFIPECDVDDGKLMIEVPSPDSDTTAATPRAVAAVALACDADGMKSAVLFDDDKGVIILSAGSKHYGHNCDGVDMVDLLEVLDKAQDFAYAKVLAMDS